MRSKKTGILPRCLIMSFGVLTLSIRAVDLFCGAGGLTHGLVRTGIDVVAGYDIVETCRHAYEHNNNAEFINKSVTELTASELTAHFDGAEVSLLAGCAPCQPFSSYSRKRNSQDDERSELLGHFGELVQQVKPDYVTMENVPGMLTKNIFHDFINTLQKNDYHIDYKVVFCPDYGMAQSRKRLVLVASRLAPIKLIEPTHTPETYVTVRDVIASLPPLMAGEQHKDDPLHKASGLSDINHLRIKHSKPGGTWLDWPEHLRAECHRKDSGKTYISVYGRMEWDKVSPTMTTQCTGFGNGRFGHPEQDRGISLREAALLQSFPIDYEFLPQDAKYDLAPLAKMIGNAVPVRLGEIVGMTIFRHAKSLQLTS